MVLENSRPSVIKTSSSQLRSYSKVFLLPDSLSACRTVPLYWCPIRLMQEESSSAPSWGVIIAVPQHLIYKIYHKTTEKLVLCSAFVSSLKRNADVSMRSWGRCWWDQRHSRMLFWGRLWAFALFLQFVSHLCMALQPQLKSIDS